MSTTAGEETGRLARQGYRDEWQKATATSQSFSPTFRGKYIAESWHVQEKKKGNYMALEPRPLQSLAIFTGKSGHRSCSSHY